MKGTDFGKGYEKVLDDTISVYLSKIYLKILSFDNFSNIDNAILNNIYKDCHSQNNNNVSLTILASTFISENKLFFLKEYMKELISLNDGAIIFLEAEFVQLILQSDKYVNFISDIKINLTIEDTNKKAKTALK